MAQCKYCGRNGWLLQVSDLGVCSNCAPIIAMDVKQRTRIIQESEKLINNSKKLDTKLSRCEVIIEQATALLKYEQYGINVTTPLPSHVIAYTNSIKGEILISGLQGELENATMKAQVATTPKTKINHYTKVLLKVMEYKNKLQNPQQVEKIEAILKHNIHQIQLDSYLDDAKKAEFKNQRKKALDKYYEALYFLKHDEIDDSVQQDHISMIEQKIKDLSD